LLGWDVLLLMGLGERVGGDVMTSEQSGVVQANARPRILFIDDEVMLGQTFKLGLEDVFDVELESTGRAALNRLLGEEAFDAVFCDIRLPELSGLEIRAALSERCPALLSRFVLMTGGAVTEEARDFLDTYSGPVLNKPFRLGDVEKLTNRLVETEGLAGGRARFRQ
jgi:two-component system, cell cycle sensor histidine kinase and response regulator CckA